MKKLISLMLVITMILGTITMTNVFVANADTPLAIDSSLVFDLDFSKYSADDSLNKGLENAAASTDKTSEFTHVKGVSTGAEELEGNSTPVEYIEINKEGGASGIGVKNTDFNNAPDITIETWTKTDNFDGHMFLYGSGAPWAVEVLEEAGSILFKNSNKGNIKTTFETGKWNHIVTTIDRSTEDTNGNLTVYINGDKVNTVDYTYDAAFSANADAVMAISAGAQNRSDLVYAGKFAEVKFYKAVMTEAEVKAKFEAALPNYTAGEVKPIEEKLVFDLDFSGYRADAEGDNKGIKNAKDDSTTGISITGSTMVKGTDTINDNPVPYIQAQGGADGINVVNSVVNSSPDLTVEAWIMDDKVEGHMFLYGNRTGNWQLQVCSSGGASPIWTVKDGPAGNSANGQMSISKLELNKWKHLVITLDRSTLTTNREIKVYVDGVFAGSNPMNIGKVYSPSDVGTESPFRISGGGYSSLSSTTKFADVKLYTGIMTAEEAMTHYLAERDTYTEKKKVFGLDLSGYNAGAEGVKGIANAVTGNTSVLSAIGTPTVATETINDNVVSYLQPVSPSKAYSGGVKVQDNEIMGNPGITIESWMRWDPTRDPNGTPPSTGYNGHLAMLTNGTTHSLQLHDVSSVKFRGSVFATATPSIEMSNNDYANKWIHYVVTREYDEVTHNWTGNVYVNGARVGNPITQAATSIINPFRDQKTSSYYMVIGGYNGEGTAFNGDIGTFNVYNYALSQEEAAANYAAEQETWEQEVVIDNSWLEEEGDDLVFDLNIGDYNRDTKTGLTNAATEFAGTGSVSFPDATAPILVTEENAKGETLKALRFINNDENATPAGGVKILQPEAMGNKEITVELWVKHTPRTYGNEYGMMLALPSALAKSDYSMQILRQTASTRNTAFKPYGTGIKGDADLPSENISNWSLLEDDYANKWTHYTITRKLEKQDDESWKWTAKFYIDGEASGKTLEYTAGNPLQYEGDTDFFMLGQYKNLPFEGNIGDFKVYNYAKTGTAVASTYNTEKEIWKPYVAKVGQFFDLDIDDYNETTKEVKNSVERNNSEITVTKTPGLVVENTTAGVRRYLEFTEAGGCLDDPETKDVNEQKNATGKGYFSVKDNDMVGKENLTIEAWIKQKIRSESYVASGHALMLTNGGTTPHSLQVLTIGERDYAFGVKPFGSHASNATMKTSTSQEWTHVAVAREYDKVTEKWDAYIYINGELIPNDGQATAEEGVILPTYNDLELEGINGHLLDDDTYSLDVGAYGKNNIYFTGYLGDLKMYNTPHTAEAVKASYDASKALYRAEIVDGAICVGNTSFWTPEGYGLDNLTPLNTKVTAKYKIINYTEAAVTPGVAVLGYYENDVLQKVVLDTTTAFAPIEPLATSPEYTISIEGIAPKEGSYLRLFVWDGLENLAPVVVNKADMILNYDASAAND